MHATIDSFAHHQAFVKTRYMSTPQQPTHTGFKPRTSLLANWVDEDDDEDEVGLKEKPEDTRYIKKITSK